MSYDSTTSQLFDVVSQALMRAGMTAARIGGDTIPSLKETPANHTVRTKNMPTPKFSDMFEGDNPNAGSELVAELNDKVDAWLAKYFPSINGQFQNVPEDWLVGVISGVKPFGIDSTVFDLVWHNARDRAYRTVTSERRTLEAAFSQRGFTLPPGALVDALVQSEQRGTDAILDVNRDEAVKDAEIKKDILQYAVGIASQLKQGILNTSAEFFRVYHSAYNNDLERARIRASAYSTYYNALSTYYGVEVSWEELRMRAAELKAGVDGGIDRNRIAASTGGGAAAAHAQASRGFSGIAAGAASAAGSLVAEIESL